MVAVAADSATAIISYECRRRSRRLMWFRVSACPAQNAVLAFYVFFEKSSFYTCPMAIINTRMLLTLFAPLILTLQMHTDMGDERGIRLRCICLGDAALRGSRMSARGLCSKVSEPCFARSSLSIARSSVCAVSVFAY